MVSLVVIFKIKDDCVSTVLEGLKTLVTETRKEAGCIRYDLVEVKDAVNTFMFLEEWTSQQDLDEHLQTKHIKDYQALSQGMFDSKDVYFYNPYL